MHMAGNWLTEAAAAYNSESIESKDVYPAHVLMPLNVLSTILEWTFQSLPDEILVGMDADTSLPHPDGVEEALQGADFEDGLFSGQGFILGTPHLVNRGDSYSVHHVPEEWMDGLFDESRGVRGGRFSFWLHAHPNAPAIPSGAAEEGRPGLGRAVTGHLIHGLELIAFHRRGFGINVILTDSSGVPIGWN